MSGPEMHFRSCGMTGLLAQSVQSVHVLSSATFVEGTWGCGPHGLSWELLKWACFVMKNARSDTYVGIMVDLQLTSDKQRIAASCYLIVLRSLDALHDPFRYLCTATVSKVKHNTNIRGISQSTRAFFLFASVSTVMDKISVGSAAGVQRSSTATQATQAVRLDNAHPLAAAAVLDSLTCLYLKP